MIPTDIQQKMAIVQSLIFSEDYFVERYAYILNQRQLSAESVENYKYDDKTLVELAHYFWESLPDTGRIRRVPFYDLCDVAENIFDYGVDPMDVFASLQKDQNVQDPDQDPK